MATRVRDVRAAGDVAGCVRRVVEPVERDARTRVRLVFVSSGRSLSIADPLGGAPLRIRHKIVGREGPRERREGPRERRDPAPPAPPGVASRNGPGTTRRDVAAARPTSESSRLSFWSITDLTD